MVSFLSYKRIPTFYVNVRFAGYCSWISYEEESICSELRKYALMEKNDDKVVFGLKVLSTDISNLYGGITFFASDTAIEDAAVWLHSAALSVV